MANRGIAGVAILLGLSVGAARAADLPFRSAPGSRAVPMRLQAACQDVEPLVLRCPPQVAAAGLDAPVLELAPAGRTPYRQVYDWSR